MICQQYDRGTLTISCPNGASDISFRLLNRGQPSIFAIICKKNAV
jgi:hypothetical protein